MKKKNVLNGYFEIEKKKKKCRKGTTTAKGESKV